MNFKIKGIHHIELTVPDLSVSKDFYAKLPGFNIVAEHPHFVMFCTGSFYLGLTDHNGKLKEKRFDELNVGMDHLSFEVSSQKDLEEAERFFDANKVSHGEIKKLSNGTAVLAFRDPDNIQLELAFRK